MNVKELVEWCNNNGVSLETQIAIGAKDDYLLTEDKLKLAQPYFGNCDEGSEYIEKHGVRNEDGDIDHDKTPKFLILDSGRG